MVYQFHHIFPVVVSLFFISKSLISTFWEVELIVESSFFDTWAGSTFLYPIILPRLFFIGTPFSSSDSSSSTSSSLLSLSLTFFSLILVLAPVIPPVPPVWAPSLDAPPAPTPAVDSATLDANCLDSSSSPVFSNRFPPNSNLSIASSIFLFSSSSPNVISCSVTAVFVPSTSDDVPTLNPVSYTHLTLPTTRLV